MVSRVQFLRENLPGFSELHPKNQRFVDAILFSRKNRHYIYPDAKSFSKKFLRTLEVPGNEMTFRRVNEKLNLFYTNGSYKPDGFSQPWWLTENAKSVIIQFASQCTVDQLMGKCEKVGVPIRVEDVRNYMNTEASYDEMIECAYLLSAVAGETLNNDYKRLPCGREVAIGQYSLQHMPKWLRNKALRGWWDYDFKNCHYVIATTLGNFPSIEEYVDNTDEHRKRLAEITGAEECNVKQALLSKAYGAKDNSSFYGAVGKYLGKSGAEAFLSDWLVKGITHDLSRLKPILLEKADKNALIGSDNSKCAQAMMLYESTMLDLAIKNLDNPVKMFDGFITPERQDKDAIQKKIRQQMHIPIEVTEEKIGEKNT